MDIAEKLGQSLIAQQQTITSAESLTAGLFLSTLGNVPGISQVLPGGFVTYSAETKASMVGVSMDLINQKGVVSAEVAEEMVKGAQQKLGTDWAVSFTGVAGPGPADGHVAGTVYMGLAKPDGDIKSQKKIFKGDRLSVRSQAVETMMTWVLDELENNR